MNPKTKNPQEPSTGDPQTIDLADGESAPWTGEERRKHTRVRFRRVIRVRIDNASSPTGHARSAECQVNAETLSTGGISFVAQSRIEQKEMQIALDLSDGSILWFHAEIVRSRPLEDGSGWEFGAAFRGITSFEV